MLILTRRIGESITIGANIRITVLKKKRNEIRLGIQAPRSVHIVRAELEPQSEQYAAALSGDEREAPEIVSDALA